MNIQQLVNGPNDCDVPTRSSSDYATSDADILKNLEDQQDELLALSSIYDDKVLLIDKNFTSGVTSGQLVLHPVLPVNFHVVCTTTAAGNINKYQEVEVEFLPPIILHFNFPTTYPSQSWPAFLISCQWLTLKQISALCSQLENLWKENCGEVVLFRWSQFLQEDTLSFLNITNTLNISSLLTYCRKKGLKSTAKDESSVPYKQSFTPQIMRGYSKDDCRAVTDISDGSILLPHIIEYNEIKKEEAFIHGWYTCKICLTEKIGSNCIRFHGCDHVFCRNCMKGYFSVQIRDGNVKLLACPNEKCSSQALPSQVYELVGPELFNRYDELLLAKTLDSMSDVKYCPRLSCQSAVLVEPDYPMGCCPVCQYVFCLFCRLAYHGVAPCRFRPEERSEIRQKYMAATNQEKYVMESRYGKQILQNLVNDTLSEDWLQTNTKNCPSCSAAIEKLDGCNKMVCWRCNTFFCWLCRIVLDINEPYKHFRDRNSKCFDMLFHGLAADDDDDEWDFGLF